MRFFQECNFCSLEQPNRAPAPTRNPTLVCKARGIPPTLFTLIEKKNVSTIELDTKGSDYKDLTLVYTNINKVNSKGIC